MFDLTGKRALVTGASGGIGREIAKALAGAGATVGLSGTRLAALEEVKAETGWDGSFQLLTPTPTDYALAYQALFNNVGFNAQIDQVASFLELVERTNLSSNFDVSIHVITTYETNVYQALSRSLSSGSRSNWSNRLTFHCRTR